MKFPWAGSFFRAPTTPPLLHGKQPVGSFILFSFLSNFEAVHGSLCFVQLVTDKPIVEYFALLNWLRDKPKVEHFALVDWLRSKPTVLH
jgi:hypothetical protein